MGRFITKTAKDQDLYIEWSTIVDAPTAVFESAEELRQYLIEEYGMAEASRADRTISRAQETGSSVMGFKVGTWDDDMLVVMEGAPPRPSGGHLWYLPRERQTAYARALLADDPNEANNQLLLIQVEDHEELED